jgi:hypothetical protein
MGISHAAEGVGAVVIGINDQDVGFFAIAAAGLAGQGHGQQKQGKQEAEFHHGKSVGRAYEQGTEKLSTRRANQPGGGSPVILDAHAETRFLRLRFANIDLIENAASPSSVKLVLWKMSRLLCIRKNSICVLGHRGEECEWKPESTVSKDSWGCRSVSTAVKPSLPRYAHHSPKKISFIVHSCLGNLGSHLPSFHST